MNDWEALHEALELWAASQKCVRGHVHLIQEVAERLHAQRIRDSELIEKLSKQKTVLIEEGDVILRECQELEAKAKVLERNAEHLSSLLEARQNEAFEAEARVKDLEESIQDAITLFRSEGAHIEADVLGSLLVRPALGT